jgi:hypothetical protein
MALENQEADDAAFDAGYSDEVTPTETPAAAPKEPVAEVAPVEVAPVDPLVEIRAQLAKFEQGHSTLAGHIGGLQRTTKELNERLATGLSAATQVADAPTQAQVQAAVASPAKWEKLKGEFPEWADATDENIDAKIAARLGAQQFDPAAFDRMISDRMAGQTNAMRKEIIDSTLDAVLDGWQAEVASPRFTTWLAAQPEPVKALANSDRVGDAARMLKLYDKSINAPAPSAKKPVDARQKRLEAAIAPRGTGGIATPRSELDEFEAGYAS